MKTATLTHQRLLEALNYNPETGLWHWLIKINNRNPGDQAGFIDPQTGRKSARNSLRIDGERFYASRLAYFYMTGAWPVFEMDHINGNSRDDSWANLRQATRGQNEINKGPYRNNKLGLKGVRYYARDGKYRATIHRNYKRKELGAFETPEEAAAAYIAAAKAIDGEFANIGAP